MGKSALIDPMWVTTKEAAELADYTPQRVRQLARGGLVEAQKVGRDWLINRRSLLAHKAQAKPGPKPSRRRIPGK
jgi:excisionase family DNA binding protein